MMKKNLLSLSFLCVLSLAVKAQDPVVMTINDKPVTKSEFEAVFNKNNNKEKFVPKDELELMVDTETLEPYRELFGKDAQSIDEEYRTTLINFAKYKLVMFTMAKIMEMEQIQRNKVILFLFNSVK